MKEYKMTLTALQMLEALGVRISELGPSVSGTVEIRDEQLLVLDARLRLSVEFEEPDPEFDDPNEWGVDINFQLDDCEIRCVSHCYVFDTKTEPNPTERIARSWTQEWAPLLFSFLHRDTLGDTQRFSAHDDWGFHRCEGYISPLRFYHENPTDQWCYTPTLQIIRLGTLFPCMADLISDEGWKVVSVSIVNPLNRNYSLINHKTAAYIPEKMMDAAKGYLPTGYECLAIIRKCTDFVPQTEEEIIETSISKMIAYFKTAKKRPFNADSLREAGVDPAYIHHLLCFVPLAFYRVEHPSWEKIRRASTYSWVRKDGSYETNLPLNDVAVYRIASKMGEVYSWCWRSYDYAFRFIAANRPESEGRSSLDFSQKQITVDEPMFCEEGTHPALYRKVKAEILEKNKQKKPTPSKKWWKFWK